MKPKLSKDEINKQIKIEAENNVSEKINRKRLLLVYGSCILFMALLIIFDSNRNIISQENRGMAIILFGIIFTFAVMTDLPVQFVRLIPIKRNTSLLMKEVYEHRRIIDEKINSAPIEIKEQEESIKYYHEELEKRKQECEEDIKSAEEEIESLEHEAKILQLIKTELFPI
ncbi:MAG: hypothetical protein WCN88_05270 [Candidatus Falkowbacteria bacterium]